MFKCEECNQKFEKLTRDFALDVDQEKWYKMLSCPNCGFIVSTEEVP